MKNVSKQTEAQDQRPMLRTVSGIGLAKTVTGFQVVCQQLTCEGDAVCLP
jgi:hypothetical protein